MNFLESLAAEWYGYQEYFIRSNVHTRPLKHGGYSAELDVLAYLPKNGELLHVETSSDALAWPEREKRIRKKFEPLHKKEYEKLLNVKIKKVRKIAICGFSYHSNGLRWNEIEVKTVREFIREISESPLLKNPVHKAVPESYPLLRAIQWSAWAMKEPRVTRRR